MTDNRQGQRGAPQKREQGRDHLRVVHDPAIVAGRVPPHDLDAEAAVISGALLGHSTADGRASVHREQIDHALDLMEPEHCYSDANRWIWDAIRTVAAAGKPVDIITVSTELRDRGRFEQVGGKQYLEQLADKTPAVANVVTHAETVIKKWRMRRTIATAQRIAAEGYGDVGPEDEFIHGAAVSFAEIDTTKPSAGEGVAIGQAMEQAEARIKSVARGVSFGLLTGFAMVDELTGGLQAKEVTVLGAPPKTGKTSFARAVSMNVAATGAHEPDGRLVGQGVIFVSLEMTEEEQALAWACTVARVDSKRVTMGRALPEELEAVGRAMSWLKTLPIVIYGRRSIRVHEMKGICREAKGKLLAMGAKPRLIVADHLQLLAKNEPREPGRNDSSVIGDVSRGLGDIAVYTGLPVLVLSQVTEDEKGRMKARGSGDIEADAQHIWMLEVFDDKPAPTFPAGRPMTPVEATLTVKRSRSGPKGSRTLWFTPGITSFSETIWQEDVY